MSDNTLFPVPADVARRAWIDKKKYQEMYQQSVDDPEGFWGEQGKRLDWIKPYTKVKDISYDPDDLHIRWFEDGDAERLRQLPRPPSRRPRRQDRDHLGGRRSRAKPRTSPIASCTPKSASSPTC